MRLLTLVSLGACLGAILSGCEKKIGSGPIKNAARFAFLGGASGELSEPNFFIDDLQGLRKSLVARGWQVRTAAGSKDGWVPESVSATNANLLKGVHETLQAAAAGQEALILFHSHGREREAYWGQRSHSIVSEDHDDSGNTGTIGNDPGFDLDAIEPEILEAQARGVRVGLVDLSCYSGSSQALKGAACKVSLAASSYISLCSGREEERGFNSSFFKLPDPGIAVSLEAQFLQARRFDHNSLNLAQISSRATPALEGWEKFLVSADPLDTFEDLKNLKTGTKPFDPHALTRGVESWIAQLPTDQQGAARSVRDEIARHLDAALALRKNLESRMPALANDYDINPLEVQPRGREPAKLAPAYLFELLDAAQNDRIPEGYSDAQKSLLKAVKPMQSELAKKFAAPIGGFHARREEFDQKVDEFARESDALFAAERKLYDLRPSTGAAANPCSDFAL